MIAGAIGWFDIREYILGHHDWFKRNDMFLKGIPADATIARIISMIDPEQFHECFINWMSSIHTLTEGQVIAIDSKTLRGSYNRQDRASTIHMISAYASSNKLVLGQLKTEEKSNEITAITELIKMLDIKGAPVTIDAMACQTKIAKAIVEQGGGRIESRQYYIFDSKELDGNFSRWKGLKSIIMVENFRLEKGKTVELEYCYYISSKELSAEQAAMAVREHWGIESMHWMLDVTMNEDACQIYKDYVAENFLCLSHTFASHFMMNRGNILVLQNILGHTDISMTMRYSHFAPNHLSDAFHFNPLNSLP